MISLQPLNFSVALYRQSVKFNSNPIAMRGNSQDTFVRSSAPKTDEIQDKPIAADESESEFLTFVKEYDLVKKLPEILTPDNILGEGFSHKTYSLPNCNDYILRTLRYETFKNTDFENAELKDTKDKNLKINIGQEIGRIYLKDKDCDYSFSIIEVLRRQSGVSLGNPPSQVLYDENGNLRPGKEPYGAKSRKDKYASSLEKLANFPVKTYEKLISDYKQVSEAGYVFDYLNSNNLRIDEENRAINFIDMDYTKNKTTPDYGNLLYALTNIDYFETYSSEYGDTPVSDDEVKAAVKNTITVTDKFLEAMKNQGEKLDFESPTIYFHRFMRSTPVAYYCKTFDINEIKQFFKQKLSQDD